MGFLVSSRGDTGLGVGGTHGLAPGTCQPGATGWSSLQSPHNPWWRHQHGARLPVPLGYPPGPKHSHPFVHYCHLLSLSALKFMLWCKWTRLFHSSLQAKSIYKAFYRSLPHSFPRPVLFVFHGAYRSGLLGGMLCVSSWSSVLPLHSLPDVWLTPLSP